VSGLILQVLLVEDNSNDAELILRELRKANGFQILYERVDNEDSFKKALHRQIWDIIICDFALPAFSATRVLELMDGYGLTTPFILVSGKIDRSEATNVLGRKSVHGFVSKDALADLGPLFRREVKLSSQYDQMLQAWSQALGLRDKETEGHSERVTELTVRLARVLGISETEIVHIRRGALMHDVGKMGIPDSILLKPGKLDEDELSLMRQHPKIAYDLLRPMEYLQHSLAIPYCHHEHWDGTGYPRGLKGDSIPFAARIFSIVDTYDALTNDRPYRKASSAKDALEYIEEQAGKLFDPAIVKEFIQIMRQELA
jgi:response regulator RpfG family c-di-GMP phosphodiesterase